METNGVEKRILLVEDDDALRNSLAEQLRLHEEFETIEATNGLEALEATKTQRFDLVLLDIGLPDFDGREVCRLMRRGGTKTPIIILTGADTWAVEAVPGENAERPFECHVQMQTRRGIWNLENMDLSQLVADKAYEFLFVWSPLKIKGGTGSPGNPVALY